MLNPDIEPDDSSDYAPTEPESESDNEYDEHPDVIRHRYEERGVFEINRNFNTSCARKSKLPGCFSRQATVSVIFEFKIKLPNDQTSEKAPT